MVSFAAGEPDFPTPAHIVDAARLALDAQFTKYTSNPGVLELRQAIVERTLEMQLLLYRDMTFGSRPADLIVWPETALSESLLGVPAIRNELLATMAASSSML